MHTKGPWTYRLSTGRQQKYYVASGNDCVVSVHGEITPQDARLIAAAPDLLAALQSCQEDYRDLLRNSPSNEEADEIDAMLVMIDAAIAKATAP